MDHRGATADFRINNFDLLRIIAASQVMFGHAIVHLGIPAPEWLMHLLYAFPGVPIFFVISGFLISASFERSSSLGNYCRNRMLRIFPGLWCCILATVLVAAACGYGFMNKSAATWVALQLGGLIYTPSFLAGFGTGSYNGSLWTIPVELQFYVALPMLYWLLAVRRRPASASTHLTLVWLAFIAIGFAANLLVPPQGTGETGPALAKLLRYSFLPHFFLFMTGVVMQRYRLQESGWIAGKGFWWLAAYLLFHYTVPESAATYVPSTLLLGVVTVSMAYTAPQTARQWLRGNDISYGVYIYHGLLINIFLELGLTGRTGLLFLLVLCTYLVGYLSWVMVERPFLRRKKRTSSAAPVAVAPLAAQGQA
jgi:peptidoglycan/LPS O-acetylase OafA/YrhL